MWVKYDFMLGKLRTDEAWSFSWTISADQVIYNGASPAQFAVWDSPIWAPIGWKSLQSIKQEERVGYVEPLFTAFNIAAFNPGGIREMGNSYSLSGSQTFTWSISTPSNVQPNSLVIRDMTNSVDLGTGLANDGSEALNIGSISFNPATPSTVSQQRRITGLDTNSASIASNPAWINIRTVSTQFVYPTFAGLVTNIADIFTSMTRAQMQLLPMNTLIVPKQNNSTTNTPTNQRFAIAYPASYGLLTSILDNTGINNTISDYTTATFNLTSMLDGATVSYRYYILNNLTTQALPFTNQFRF